MLGNEQDVLQFRLQNSAPIINVNPSHLALPDTPPVADGTELTLADIQRLTAADGTPVRYISAAVRMQDGSTVVISAAHFMNAESQMLAAFRLEIMGAVLLAYVLIAALGYSVIRRGLRPLRKMALEAASIHPTSLSTRLSSEDAPQELQPLILVV
ncbi:hypothetical protein ACVWWB_001873 [Ewingella americana]